MLTNFQQEKRQILKDLYNHGQGNDSAWLSRIDVWIGGILETGDAPGELFRTIIKDQFLRIRNADRFWFESKQNKYAAGSFDVFDLSAMIFKLGCLLMRKSLE